VPTWVEAQQFEPAEEANVPMQTASDSSHEGFMGFAAGVFASLSGFAAAFLTYRARIWQQFSATAQRDEVELRQTPFLFDLSPEPTGLAGAEPVYAASPELRGTYPGALVANFTPPNTTLTTRASAFAPPNAVSTRGTKMQMQQSTDAEPSQIEKDLELTPAVFKQLDVDGGGSISVDELKAIFGNKASADINKLMKRADLDGNGELDYAEYERLMNMQKFGDEQGGNLYVRNAINLGLLKPDSILADGEAAILVGNKGFDPLNCATDIGILKKYREAETKHGRLAMLAAVGWPISELAQPYLAKLTNSPDLLTGNEQAPSLLNGGLDRVNPLFFMAVIVFSATVEATALKLDRTSAEYTPGDLGFDPLNLYTGESESKKRELELKELNNGRLAMIAIVVYAFQEFIAKDSVITKSPALFKSVL
jgi:hypothetical protein